MEKVEIKFSKLLYMSDKVANPPPYICSKVISYKAVKFI